jgi:hypothetical protein
MSFNHANVKARQEESRRRAQCATTGSVSPVSPVVLGVPGGEFEGSVVGWDVSTPVEGDDFWEDSDEEEMLDKLETKLPTSPAEKQEKKAVTLVFPLLAGQFGADNEWPWNLCGGLIDGAKGNRFYTKTISDPTCPHCGIGSHAAHKATLKEGHGYIPSVTDRANAESAYLDPSVDADRCPGAFSVLLRRLSSYEEWIASFTALTPTVEEMKLSTEVAPELVAEAMEKSSHVVSFAITPASKKLRLTNLVSDMLVSKNPKNLASRFDDEDPTTKMDVSFENLEVPVLSDWTEVEATSTTFAPTVGQWNSLVGQVTSLKADLEKAVAAIAVLSEVAKSRFELVDDQVVHLRGSVRSRPSNLGPNLPALDLWKNVEKLADEVADAQGSLEKTEAIALRNGD